MREIRWPAILFEDANLIVIDKPAGLLSQGEHTGDPNVVDWLRERLGRPYVGLVHRLDRNTSGLMVVAKRTKAARRLTEALQDGRLLRSYQGWVEGDLSKPENWRHRLVKDEKTNTTRALPASAGRAPEAKAASLDARPVARARAGKTTVTLVEFTLETGRSHQIRAQAAAQGHPLLGDVKYGARERFARLALHSCRLEFPHPISGETLRFEAPLPDELRLAGTTSRSSP